MLLILAEHFGNLSLCQLEIGLKLTTIHSELMDDAFMGDLTMDMSVEP